MLTDTRMPDIWEPSSGNLQYTLDGTPGRCQTMCTADLEIANLQASEALGGRPQRKSSSPLRKLCDQQSDLMRLSSLTDPSKIEETSKSEHTLTKASIYLAERLER